MTHEKEIKDFIEANTPVIFGGAKWGGNRDTKLHKAIKAMYEENKKLKQRIAELEKWQPIETAPESKMVIVLKDGEVHKAERMLGHYWALPEKDNCGFRHNIKDPECWTPLPTPPQENE